MKRVSFIGNSREALQNFPASIRYRAGVELRALQNGFEPDDWKPLKAIGSGVREIRIRDREGAFRIIYVANIAEDILVLHAFQKKSQKTSRADIALASQRLQEWKSRQ